jgi:hypothetical protein
VRIPGLALPLSLALFSLACPGSKEGRAPPVESPPPEDPAAAAEAPTAPAATPEPAPGTESDSKKTELSWTAVSPDDQAALIQTGDLRGQCVAECSKGHGAEKLWRAEKCFGTKLDLRFISNDCEKVVVLHQLPRSAGIPQQTVVGEVFQRDKRKYTINAGATVKDWSKVRSGGNTFYWVAGTLGMPGTAPHYSADGQAVELETVDGKKHSIPLTVTK